ncbi:hypothetical protein C7212DRAFT_356968 [Tuber magnatum]|uniref:Up-regulated during septation protein 1 domain-containing protein n=1 Tax=Tuber magnatum TaxID=42249 RepID=A0A317ST26_9PEZI|nr:hypothetical protein C7212DRAFT_356968 [Tuber magnatum]
MSLSPFPARGGIPPPVPPKISALPHIAALAIAGAPTTLQKHKKNAPSLSKAISFDNFVNFYSNSRNPSPTKQLEISTSPVESPHTKTAPLTTVMGPKETSGSGLQNLSSQPSGGFSLASAKQKAKGVFTARRKGSQSDLEMMETVQEVCMDSPTIPGRPAIYQEVETTTGWRNNAFSEILVSSISSPLALDTLPAFSPMETPIKKPVLPLAFAPPPQTPWPAAGGDTPPRVPPKTGPILQRAPTLLEKRVGSLEIAERGPERERVGRRPRADSAPPVRHTSTRIKPHVERHKRKKSSISPSLPLGVKPSKAPVHYPYNQIESLQTAAKLRSEEFCVLRPKDVEGLSKELSQLETRCRYLRETHKSLRDGRRTLHARILAYLRSSRSAVFSRESLLKQEEALAELDAAIDDWHNKLEKAEDRRARVKEKLLEHLAAALSVPDCAYPPSERGTNTPPATPERQGRSGFVDGESITIYALLADVEQEIKRSTAMGY